MDDVLKKIESLEKRIKELESLKKPNSLMFGRSYSQVGDSNSDFLIKTKGQVKIQWGQKFIDLIKDGKINVDEELVFKIQLLLDEIDNIKSKIGLLEDDTDSNEST